MTGQHRPSRRPAARYPLVLASAVALVIASVLVVQNLADAGGCGEHDGIRVPVAADPAIAPAIRQAADDWARQNAPTLNGACVVAEVTAVPSADIAGQVAQAAGGFLDVASPAPAGGELPTVWVPDSSYWTAQLRSVSRTLFAAEPVPLATSPIVLAVSPAAAELLGDGPVTPADLREPVLAGLAAEQRSPVRLAEPRRDAASLIGAGWLRQAIVTTEADLPSLVAAFRGLGSDAPPDASALLTRFDALQRATPAEAGEASGLLMAPVSEQTVASHNQAVAATPISSVPMADAPSLDFPYTILSGASRDQQSAAGMLRAALVDAGEVFAGYGFRAAQPSVPVIGPLEQLAPVLRIWSSATRDARVLSVVNVSASMAEPMGLARRIDVFRATAEQGLALFTDASELGHWEYAEEPVEGVPISTLTDRHRQRVLDAIGQVEPRPTNESALFETLLEGYRVMKEGFDPSRSNTLILWTDGGNRQSDGLTLEETLRELERQADLTRPIRVILLGLGPDADMEQLTAIARATGGGAFHLQDPEQIALIFLQALLT